MYIHHCARRTTLPKRETASLASCRAIFGSRGAFLNARRSLYEILLDYTGLYWIKYDIIVEHTRLYWTIPDYARLTCPSECTAGCRWHRRTKISHLMSHNVNGISVAGWLQSMPHASKVCATVGIWHCAPRLMLLKREARACWLRTNGVNTNGAAANVKMFDRLGKEARPGTFGNSRLTGVPKKPLCRTTWNLQWPR